MEIIQYFERKKEFYDIIYSFFNEDNEKSDSEYQNIITFLNTQQIDQDVIEMKAFLQFISKISKNHHATSLFFSKIEHILLHYKESIKQTFSNEEIFDIFKNSRRILRFIFKNGIIVVDDFILTLLLEKSRGDFQKAREIFLLESDLDDTKSIKFYYYYYFYQEMKSLFDDEDIKTVKSQLIEIDQFFDDQLFERKCEEGENDSEICYLIRNDSIEDFVSLMNRTNISPSRSIKPSIFETNSFLIKNNERTSLIEYAAFFGSIQIFNYLRMSKAELRPALWLYSIHSNNAEMIHLLEENHVKPPNDSFLTCLEEAIKCHHNEIARYIQNSLIEDECLNKFDKSVISFSLHYHNYSFLPDDFLNDPFIFIYFCSYNYVKPVELYLKNKDIKFDINQRVIFKKKLF